MSFLLGMLTLATLQAGLAIAFRIMRGRWPLRLEV